MGTDEVVFATFVWAPGLFAFAASDFVSVFFPVDVDPLFASVFLDRRERGDGERDELLDELRLELDRDDELLRELRLDE